MDYSQPGTDDGVREMSQKETGFGFQMKHSGTRRLFEYWSDLRGGREAPYKADVTARGIGRALASNAFILEDLGEGNQRFRLAGSRLYDFFWVGDPRHERLVHL